MALAALIPFAVDIASGLLNSGGDAAPGTLGEPSAGVILQLMQKLSSGERAQLAQLFTAANPGVALFDAAGNMAISPADFAFRAWGGDDGQVTSTNGKALKAYLVQLLTKYQAGGTLANPAFIPQDQYIPELDSPAVAGAGIGGGINVTGHIGSDGKWHIDVGGAAGDPGYVEGARPFAWVTPVAFAAGAVALVLILRRR